MNDLQGKTAVITGAASGIGLALAHRFGTAGMSLVVADVEAEPLATAAGELEAAGFTVATFEIDVRDMEQIVALEAFAKERFGNVHLLCNNAGVGSGGPVSGLDDIELWKWTIDVNLWGVIYGCKAFLPAIVEHGEPAHIVNTASMAGLASGPMMGPYNVSKYGVVALSETMSKEMQLAGTAVGVSVLCPAFVQTSIASSRRNLPEELQTDEADDESGPMQQVIQGLIDNGLPTEFVANAVHDAVIDNAFWILTHDESRPAVTERARQIVEGENPPLTGFV